jgi:hypothetical protein
MSISKRKFKLTLDQLVEGIVWSSHAPTDTSKVDWMLLKETFEPSDENSETRLKFEYNFFCFSIRCFRYSSYLQTKNGKKVPIFGEMTVKFLKSHLQEIFSSDIIENLCDIYATRIKSYESSYNSPNQIQNTANLFRWHIEYGLKNEDDGLNPVKYSEVCTSDSNSRGWAECIAITENQFNLIDEHIKIIKII